MPFSFLDLSDQITINEKRLDELYKRYELYNSRFSVISILYSVMAIYLIQLLKFCFSDDNHIKVIYAMAFIAFLVCILCSIYHSFYLMIPREIAFQKLPAIFYKDLAEEYRKQEITEETLLDEYIKTSYNDQLEDILKNNEQMCFDKAQSYFNAFKYACISIMPYLFCISLYLFFSTGGSPIH